MNAQLRLLTLVATLCAGPVQAMTWAELEAEIDAVEDGAAGNRQMILRFSEMVHMLVSYTRQLHQEDLQPLACPPRGQAVNIDELVSLVRAEARRVNATPETLVQDRLLAGFRTRFPCN